jgi:PAS domain S-box-containing protein
MAGKSRVAKNTPDLIDLEALKDSEEWHRALVETAGKGGQGIIVFQNKPGREACIVFANSTASEVLGYSPVEILTLSAEDMLESSDLNNLKERYRKRQRGEQVPSHYESNLLRKDGTSPPVEASVNTMTYRGNIATLLFFKDITQRRQIQQELNKHRQHLEKLVAERTAELRETNEQLQHEITERKQTEEKLQNSERYYRSLIQNALDAMVVIGRDGIIDYGSPAIEPVRGYKPEEIVGTNGFSEVHPEDMPKAIKVYNELMRNPGASVRTEVRVRHKDDSWRIVEAIARNLLDDPIVAGIIVNYRDVTEHRKAAEELEELYRQERDLRQQLEMEMKRRVEFTRALAHELKTPLTPMLISSQVLASELKEEPLLSLARNLSRGASNMNSRIDELLDLARGEIGMLQIKVETLDTSQLLREVAEYVSPVASSRGQSLILELPDSLPLVRADNVRLRQIVLNLLNNASNYTPEGGRITLRAGRKDANLIVEVEDNGPGIAEEEQQHMFEPYHRMEVAGERLSGLGLGLTLCKTLVDLHGGQIWVKSRVGEGSTFSFSLPLEAVNR